MKKLKKSDKVQKSPAKLAKLKENLKDLLNKTKAYVKRNGEVLGQTSAVLLVAATVATMSLMAPQMRDYWLRDKVGSKSYRIVQPGAGMGTGFAIKAPSGNSYILTNDHVCEMSTDQLHLLVVDDHGEYIPRTILHRSDKTDLCLLEGMPGVEGLTLSASAPAEGDPLNAVGHPSGYLTTLTKGSLIMRKDVEIFVGIISIKAENGDPISIGDLLSEKECSKPKNRILEVKRYSPFGSVTLKVCLNVTKDAYFTTILGQPGSSGSAVVNNWGEVVAVLFAGDRSGWSILVSHDDIKDFLKKY